MGVRLIGRNLAIGLIGIACGCGEIEEKIMPDNIEGGVAARQVKGSYRGFNIDKTIPLGRIRINKKIDDKFGSYFGVDYNKGKFSASHPILDGSAFGNFTGVNAGLRYLPVSKNWGFEFGGELFYCDYNMVGGLSAIKQKTPDELFGWGLNAGLFGEIPLNDRISIIGSAGYNFTDNFTRNANANFDGFYGFISVKIRLTEQRKR